MGFEVIKNKQSWYNTELVLPMYNARPYFSLKNLGTEVRVMHGKIWSLVVTKQAWGCKVVHREYSNNYNNTVITIYGTRWALQLSEGALYNLYECRSAVLYT